MIPTILFFVFFSIMTIYALKLIGQIHKLEKKINELEKFNSYLHASNEDHRCNYCEDRDNCPAYMTGVLFPCPGYKEADNGKQE